MNPKPGYYPPDMLRLQASLFWTSNSPLFGLQYSFELQLREEGGVHNG
ncbi:hypothetical protein [Paenibacillus sonchi]|nr:hypothetical protein [Paenibacillus sonchi]